MMPDDPAQAPDQGAEHPSLQAGSRLLTIGMATYDDYDGVYFTAQAIRLYHPEVTPDTEILVLDNHPDGPAAEALRALAASIPGYRYVPNTTVTGTAVRDLVFREARTPYVLCVDCHVLLVPGALRRLLTFFHQHPASDDLFQGPIVSDDLANFSTHFIPSWNAAMYGQWSTDERGRDPNAAPFTIPMQGLGLFACRREAWVGFNPRFRGFGGEEGYLHEKFRRAGRQTWCLPFLRWVHRFGRPAGVPYPNTLEDRVRNYLIGWQEVGWDPAPIFAHFREHLGEEAFAALYRTLQQELDLPDLPVGDQQDQWIPRQQEGYALEVCETECLLYHPEQTQAVYLNQTAALIWQLCDGRRSVAEMRTALLDAYPDHAGQITEDLAEVLQQFTACGALTPA